MSDAPPDAQPDDRAIVFAYDGSEPARASILEAARQLSPGRHAVVLTVSEPLEGRDDTLRQATELAYEGARLARSVGFDAEPHAEPGEPVWRGIVDAADARHASLLVLGSHGRSRIDHVLMGSVAAAVTRHTDLPVLIVHAS
jgi:nucleotide-binding universal stress UspA family protein